MVLHYYPSLRKKNELQVSTIVSSRYFESVVVVFFIFLFQKDFLVTKSVSKTYHRGSHYGEYNTTLLSLDTVS